MDLELERLNRQSEIEIRKNNVNQMLSKTYQEKIKHSNHKVNEFVDILGLDTVFVSTSGGKDSACLSKLCKELYPNIQHVMFNTGLEYQATIDLAKKQGALIIPPKTSWIAFSEKYGYPVGSKQVSRRIHDANNTPIGCAISLFSKNYGLPNKWLHFLSSRFVDFPISGKCCDEFKKKPSKQIKLNPIIGTRINESKQRSTAWKQSGCNSYSLDYKHGVSRPISLWKEEDVERYINDNDVELSTLYTQYEQKRTGCCICPYGAHIDGSRFDLLKELEPKRYEYFMKRSKLMKVLALSNVDVVSDDEYMQYKYEVQKQVNEWHETNEGNDKYLFFKVQYALTYFTKEEMKNAVEHISKNALMYDKELIMQALNDYPNKTWIMQERLF